MRNSPFFFFKTPLLASKSIPHTSALSAPWLPVNLNAAQSLSPSPSPPPPPVPPAARFAVWTMLRQCPPRPRRTCRRKLWTRRPSGSCGTPRPSSLSTASTRGTRYVRHGPVSRSRGQWGGRPALAASSRRACWPRGVSWGQQGLITSYTGRETHIISFQEDGSHVTAISHGKGRSL